MYGIKKTTVYLPDEVKAGLERAAGETGRSEADLIRDALRALLEGQRPSLPKLPLFDSGAPTLAERVDEELAGRGPLPGFGER